MTKKRQRLLLECSLSRRRKGLKKYIICGWADGLPTDIAINIESVDFNK